MAIGVASLVPDVFLDHDWFYVILGVAVALGLGWVSLLAARRRDPAQPARHRSTLRFPTYPPAVTAPDQPGHDLQREY